MGVPVRFEFLSTRIRDRIVVVYLYYQLDGGFYSSLLLFKKKLLVYWELTS